MTINNQLNETIKSLKIEHSIRTATLLTATEQATDLYNRVLLYEEAYAESGQAESVGKELDVAYNEYDKAYKEKDYQEEQMERIEQALVWLLEAKELLDEAGI